MRILQVLLLFLPYFMFSQQAVIEGFVKEKGTGNPLWGVQIYVSELKLGIVSDSMGGFKLTLPPGSYVVVFKLMGYYEVKRQISLKPAEVLRLDVDLEVMSTLLNEVVVSAGKFDQKLSDVSVSMDLIKPSFLEANAISSLENALQKVSGIVIFDDQATIRGGSGYSYGAGSRVLFLVDDMPLLTGATGEIRWEFLPMENIKQIEIFKGPSSTLYGSSALNGIIHYRTMSPPLKPYTQFTTQLGVYGNPLREEIKWWKSFNPTFSSFRIFHGQTIKNFGYTLTGQFFSDDGYRESDNEQRGIVQSTFRYKFPKVEGLVVSLRMSYLYRQGNKFLLWRDADSGVYRKNETFQQEINNRLFDIAGSAEYWVNKRTRHLLKLLWYEVNNENNTNQNNYDDLWYGEYLFQKFQNDKGLVWSSGLVGTYNESEADIFGKRLHYGRSLALYTQADKKTGKFNLTLGGRLEGHQIDKDPATFKPVFRMGLTYMLLEQTFLRASFGQGYRYPTIAERYTATSTGTIRIFPNPSLKSESGYSAEVGFRHGYQWKKWHGYVDISGFFMRYRDMIEFQFGYFNPDSVVLVAFPPTDPNYFQNWLGFKAFNVEKAQITGTEINIAGNTSLWKLPLQWFIGYTYTYPIDLSKQQDTMKSSLETKILKYRFFHNFKGDVEIGFKKLFIGVNVEYQSKIFNIDKVFEDTIRYPNGAPILIPPSMEPAMILPGLKEYREKHNGFVVVDLRLKYEVSKEVNFIFNVRNALNKEYMIRPGDVQPPRTFIFQLQVRV
ncbi:MAG: TonB-dependent receptor [Bacteroidales bacterium]|nr:TonB-dependent receptor [Bacteroidales bacterium]